MATTTIDTKRRVKHYVLNESRQWVDQGTGHVWWHFNKRTVSLLVKSESDGSILLESKILLTIVYQRQQDTLIVWSDQNRRDMALSFQEKAGCDEIWEKICEVLGEDSSLDSTSSSSRSAGSAGSSGGSSGGGSSRSLESNLDDDGIEKDDDTDNNLSPADDLPPCELARLKDIRDYFTCFLPRHSKRYKERLAAVLESDSFIQRLIDLFHTCEDLENEDGLHYLYEIFRCLFYLNKSSLLDVLLGDDLIMDVIGCLEYDPNKAEPVRHREFISNKARFKEIISFDNSELVGKIQQTYKVQYIQDVILPAPSVFENSLTSLTSYIFLNKVEISNLIQDDERFLSELFENLKNLDAKNERHVEMLEFLREYTGFLYGLQQARDPFFKSLYDHGLLDVIELGLAVSYVDKVNQIAVDMFSHFVEVSPALVREYILNEIETKSSVNNLNVSCMSKQTSSASSSNNSTLSTTTTSGNHEKKFSLTSVSSSGSGGNLLAVATTMTMNIVNSAHNDENDLGATNTSAIVNNNLNHSVAMLSLSDILNTNDVFEPVLINYAIRQMINDPDPELSGALQIVHSLKLLIDPESMLSVTNKSEKTEFLAYFYRKSINVLVAPLITNTSNGHIHREDFLIAQLQNLILDFLGFCVEHHTYHIKNYIIHKDLLKQILVLLKSKHQFLALSALRLMRKTMSLKEETYYKHIIKSNLFEPLFEALKANASRYNILNSAILEVFEFIRSDDIKPLIEYVVESFSQFFESITYVKTFRDIKLRYEQLKDYHDQDERHSRFSNDNGTPSLYRTRGYRLVGSDRIEYDKNDDDAWIEAEDEEDEASSLNHRAYLMCSVTGSNGLESVGDVNESGEGETSGHRSGRYSSISNDVSNVHHHHHQQHQSNGPTSFAEMNMSNEFVEFKRRHQNQMSRDDDDSEDTLFSPVKASQPFHSGSPITGSFAIKTPTISIKINTTSLKGASSSGAPENDSENSMSSTDSSNTNSSNSLSPGSNPSTPSHSPLCTKKALVDYEDDSDEEEEQVNIKPQKPTSETTATSGAIISSTISSTFLIGETSHAEKEIKIEETKKESNSEVIFSSDSKIETVRKHRKEVEEDKKKNLSKDEDGVDKEVYEQDKEKESQAEINGQTEPANKRARLSST